MIGQHLFRAYLDRAKLDQISVARELGVSQSYISRILNGKQKPSLAVAARIEALSGVPAASWVERRRTARIA